MKKQLRKRIAMITVLIFMVTLWTGIALPAQARVEPSLNWGFTYTADHTLVSPDSTVTLTASFTLHPSISSGNSTARVAVFLPAGLDYSSAVIYSNGLPSVITLTPAATPMGTSVIHDFPASSAVSSTVQLRVTARVNNAWSGVAVISRAELYLQPTGGAMPNTAHDAKTVVLQSVELVTPTLPTLPTLPPIPIVPDVYMVQFDLAGGYRVGGGALVQAVPYGRAAVEPYVYREGYVFEGWNQPFYAVTYDMVVTAMWSVMAVPPIATIPPQQTLVPGYFVGQDTFIQHSHIPMIYYVENPILNFDYVEVDGYAITRDKQYIVTTGKAPGTTAIHLSASYLNTLAVGNHTLRVNFWDGRYSNVMLRVTAYSNPFYDVAYNMWYYEGVEAMNASGLMQGTNTAGTQFSPSGTMTRGMVVTILYRYAGMPSVAGFRNPFPDIPPGMWYTDAVIWAAANGIFTGYANGMFMPSNNITNEQFAAVLYRFQNAMGSRPMDILADRTYNDFEHIALYARSAVNKLTMQGVYRDLPFHPQNNFMPQESASRAVIASVMRRWIESVGW
jgi:hypothetical protein